MFATVQPIEGNRQKLDGGAMFGNCPKPLWEKWAKPDAQNRIDLACRAMLVTEFEGERGSSSAKAIRRVLFETGIGVFFEPKMRERFGVVEPEHRLLASLKAVGIAPEEIDVVVLSHLHFDHAGGLLASYMEGKAPSLVFPNASYVVSDRGWDRALSPHARDRASFIPELQPLLEQTGRLERITAGDWANATSRTLGPNYRFFFSEGHTPGLMLTTVLHAEVPYTFMGDLVPGAPWVHLPITMGYDRFPELLIEEKEALLSQIVAQEGRAFFTHDAETASAKIARDAKGRFSVNV
jgi:glyoxylase-like metal-dependent hydrolase (beta-lactamase superfamily II)